MRTSIHDEMRSKVKLAFTYAEDGAMASAARIFREIADTYQQRQEEMNHSLGALIAKNAE